MICYTQAKRYCREDISLIENYDKAMADDSQTWEIHHKLETHKYKDRSRTEWIRRDEDVSVQELKAFDVYYNRPAKELIFMSIVEHKRLHAEGRRGHIIVSEETRRRMSEAAKRRKTPPFTEEHKQKIRDALKGRIISDETKKKISETLKGQTLSEDTRRKISEKLKGKKRSEEARHHMSEAQKKRFAK